MGCHEPHGSGNPKMLVRHRPQYLLCLECHTMASGILASQPPSFHDLRSARTFRTAQPAISRFTAPMWTSSCGARGGAKTS